jgi:hypothetical protein
MDCRKALKVVRIFFPNGGGWMDHFPHDNHNSIEWLISFLGDTDGFIVAAEGLTDEEMQLLKRAGNRSGRPLLADRSKERM